MTAQPGDQAAASIAAQMRQQLAQSAVTHPEWTSLPDGQSLAVTLEGPEGQPGVIQERDEASEDAREQAAWGPAAASLATGLPLRPPGSGN
jgi:hypothetical protein